MEKLNIGTKVYLVGGVFTPNQPKTARANEPLTEGEIVEAWTEGKELVYRVRVALEDGRFEFHELVAVGSQLVKFIRTEAAQKAAGWIVRTWQRLFGRKA